MYILLTICLHLQRERLVMEEDYKKFIYTTEEEEAVLLRAIEEDTWEAYAEAQFVEDFGSGESFYRLLHEEDDSDAQH